jgi:parvulin-like peptidyl-prolyl isomerase
LAKKKRRVPSITWDEPTSTSVADKITSRGPTFYLSGVIAALVVVGLGFVAYAFVADYIGDQRRPGSTALAIDGTDYDLRYFTERLTTFVQQNGGAGSTAAQPSTAFGAVTNQIVEEAAILRFAGEFGIAASEAEVNDEIALRLNTEADSTDFETRIQDELARTGVSEDLFRNQVEASVLSTKLIEHFSDEVPDTLESIHLRQILVSDRITADEIKGEIDAGGDAAAIAEERSLDTATSAEGGDVGWLPRGALVDQVEETLFGLDTGDVTVYPVGDTAYFVYEVLDKDPARAVDSDQLDGLAGVQLTDWINEKRASMDIVDEVSTNADKFNWAIEQAYGPQPEPDGGGGGGGHG